MGGLRAAFVVGNDDIVGDGIGSITLEGEKPKTTEIQCVSQTHRFVAVVSRMDGDGVGTEP